MNQKGVLPRFVNALRLCANGLKHAFPKDWGAAGEEDTAAAASDAAAQALKQAFCARAATRSWRTRRHTARARLAAFAPPAAPPSAP